MAAFNYTAMDADGKTKKGVVEAETARGARELLRARGLIPTEVGTADEKGRTADKKSQAKNLQAKKSSAISFTLFKKKMNPGDLALLTRQMATLLAAGMPLDEVLAAVANQSEKNQIKSILLGVRSKVMEGFTLASGMDEFPEAFPKLYRTTVASGESSGKLDEVLKRLADYTEKQQAIQRKIKQALVYPTLMTVTSIFVVIFLLVYVVPKIVDVFNQTKQVLPTVTIVLLAVSGFIKKYGLYLTGGFILAALGFKQMLKKDSFREKWHRFLLKLPVLGKSIKTINGARFARTFGILNAATVPILESMNAAAKLITPIPMRRAVEASIERVSEGMGISRALQQSGYFSPMFVHLVASGEASGQLEDLLQRAAENQEADVEALIEGSLTLFEPVMILVMGGVVLFIVLAIMLPIFSLDQFTG